MADYKHGAYGDIQAVGTRVAQQSQNAIVYVGIAPVHTVQGGANSVNKPILVQNMAEARKYFGYSEDWATYTLCETMQVHLATKGIGPLVLINVLDPDKCKAAEGGTFELTPTNGRMTIAGAENIILDSVVVPQKTLDVDYTIAYDPAKKVITIAEMSDGALGTDKLKVTCDLIDPAKVDEETVIGSSDGEGLNTGIYAIKNVYQTTGFIPSMLLCPSFSSIPAVHSAMIENSKKVNGHWDVWVYADIPIVDTSSGQPITLTTAPNWKKANGYDKDNETVFFPLITGTDGRRYHISVLAAANLQELISEQDGIPYRTSSNTPCAIIQNLYMGEDRVGRIYDDEIINKKLNKFGICSAAYVGGRWAIWGAHAASYDPENGDQINVSETNRMMLFYISNDFQHRRTLDIDKPLTANDIQSIIAEEQQILDALVKIGALTYGSVHSNATEDYKSDIMNGDYSFTFNVTTTPLAKSMTAIVNWTDDGFQTYFQE